MDLACGCFLKFLYILSRKHLNNLIKSISGTGKIKAHLIKTKYLVKKIQNQKKTKEKTEKLQILYR